jgi:hypothetical protein
MQLPAAAKGDVPGMVWECGGCTPALCCPSHASYCMPHVDIGMLRCCSATCHFSPSGMHDTVCEPFAFLGADSEMHALPESWSAAITRALKCQQAKLKAASTVIIKPLCCSMGQRGLRPAPLSFKPQPSC